MKIFIFLTGILNMLTGIAFAIPGAVQKMGYKIPEEPFWLMFPAVFIFILGIILIYCSRDLKNRALIVMWDGWSRVAVFLGFVWLGLYGGTGFDKAIGAVPDLIIALVYFIGLPRVLGRSFLSILLDRHE